MARSSRDNFGLGRNIRPFNLPSIFERAGIWHTLPNGNNALSYSIFYKRADVLQKLIEMAIKAGKQEMLYAPHPHHALTLREVAVLYGADECEKLLAPYSTSVDVAQVFIEACHAEHLSCAKSLLESGVSVNAYGLLGKMVRMRVNSHFFNREKHKMFGYEVQTKGNVFSSTEAKFIQEHNPDKFETKPKTIHIYGTALISSCLRGNFKAANFLLDHKADLNIPTACGKTALGALCALPESKEKDALFKRLLQAGADPFMCKENLLRPVVMSGFDAAFRHGYRPGLSAISVQCNAIIPITDHFVTSSRFETMWELIVEKIIPLAYYNNENSLGILEDLFFCCLRFKNFLMIGDEVEKHQVVLNYLQARIKLITQANTKDFLKILSDNKSLFLCPQDFCFLHPTNKEGNIIFQPLLMYLKSKEVIRLLHSPDLLSLQEIQDFIVRYREQVPSRYQHVEQKLSYIESLIQQHIHHTADMAATAASPLPVEIGEQTKALTAREFFKQSGWQYPPENKRLSPASSPRLHTPPASRHYTWFGGLISTDPEASSLLVTCLDETAHHFYCCPNRLPSCKNEDDLLRFEQKQGQSLRIVGKEGEEGIITLQGAAKKDFLLIVNGLPYPAKFKCEFKLLTTPNRLLCCDVQSDNANGRARLKLACLFVKDGLHTSAAVVHLPNRVELTIAPRLKPSVSTVAAAAAVAPSPIINNK